MSEINLHRAEVLIREIRLGSITGFEGTAGELVSCAHKGELSDSTASASAWAAAQEMHFANYQ